MPGMPLLLEFDIPPNHAVNTRPPFFYICFWCRHGFPSLLCALTRDMFFCLLTCGFEAVPCLLMCVDAVPARRTKMRDWMDMNDTYGVDGVDRCEFLGGERGNDLLVRL